MAALRRIDATYELVTPAFAGGADTGSPELRVDGIIGQLRRWWWAAAPLDPAFGEEIGRAGQFADRLFGAAGGAEAEDGQKPKATEKKKSPGQGSFLIDIGTHGLVAKDKAPLKGARDLFGPLWGKRGGMLWGEDRSFTLSFLLRPRGTPASDGITDERLAAGLIRALKLWGLVGGLGAASRRGFGSVRLVGLRCENLPGGGWTPPQTVSEFTTRVKEELGEMSSKKPKSAGGTFSSFQPDGKLTPEIRIGGAPAGTGSDAGFQALRTLSANLAQCAKDLRENDNIGILSHQIDPRSRVPSPFHFHILPLAGGCHVAVSVLPRAGLAYGPVRAGWIVGQGTTPTSLCERLGMTRVLS